MTPSTRDRHAPGRSVPRAGSTGGHGVHDRHSDHAAVFRDRFWLTLVLAVPVVVFSGWPFLAGALTELRHRRPGMMLLIGMAITVAFAASLASSMGWFSVEVWWELALLIAIMLLGHWLEMRAVGQASSALAALAALLPDETELVTAEGTSAGPGRGPGRR